MDGDDEPAMMLVDNMEPDQNPDVGKIEITLSGDDDLGFLTLFQHTSWHFTDYHPENNEYGMNTHAMLHINGIDSDYSISGQTNPSTSNMMVFVFPPDSMEQDFPPFITFTQDDGSYHLGLHEEGSYIVNMDDGIPVYGNLYANPSYQMVDVVGHATGVDFEIMQYDAFVYGCLLYTSPSPRDS